MIPRSILTTLVVVAVVLPIVAIVLLGVAALLGAMQDAGGQAVAARLGLAVGILWIVDLVLLLVSIGIDTLGWGSQLDD